MAKYKYEMYMSNYFKKKKKNLNMSFSTINSVPMVVYVVQGVIIVVIVYC